MAHDGQPHLSAVTPNRDIPRESAKYAVQLNHTTVLQNLPTLHPSNSEASELKLQAFSITSSATESFDSKAYRSHGSNTAQPRGDHALRPNRSITPTMATTAQLPQGNDQLVDRTLTRLKIPVLSDSIQPHEGAPKTTIAVQDTYLSSTSWLAANSLIGSIKAAAMSTFRFIKHSISLLLRKILKPKVQDKPLDELMRELQRQKMARAPSGGPTAPLNGKQQIQSPLGEQEANEILKSADKKNFKIGDDPADQAGPDNTRPLDLSKLSPTTQKEISDLFDSLTTEAQEKLIERARQRALINPGASATQNPKQAQQPASAKQAVLRPASASPTGNLTNNPASAAGSASPATAQAIQQQFHAAVNKDRGEFAETVRKVSLTINKLEQDLRSIFQRRRQSHRESGRRTGTSIKISRYIKERASGKPAIETRAFEIKTRPLERDYAVSILVDASLSMEDKIQHAFAATVACTEALSRLQIKHSIYAFNRKLYTYKTFAEKTDPEKLKQLLGDICANNNDGWAIQQVAEKLKKSPEKERILIVLSDGEPAPIPPYHTPEYELKRTIQELEAEGKIRLIGLGMGPNTAHVNDYYTNARSNIPIEQLPEALRTVLREAIDDH
jgi:uncharacterized protein with von Willebrand factor type A (vWA) domain